MSALHADRRLSAWLLAPGFGWLLIFLVVPCVLVLVYSFVESVKATYPFYVIRLVGGLLYLAGMFLMAWNMVKTIGLGKAVEAPVPVAVAHA